MRITKIETIILTIPMKTFKTSLGITPEEMVLVKVHTDDGILGLGESKPNPMFGGETAADVATAVTYIGKHLIKENPFEIDRVLKRIDSILQGRPFAKFPLDTALHDIKAKALKVPIYELLGGCHRKKIPLGYSVGIASEESMVNDALKAVEQGYKAIKVKIGVSPATDLKNVKIIRDALGGNTVLRVDANQGYTPDVAIRTLRKMEKYELQLIEQPVPGWDLVGMSKVAKALDTPVMADESISKVQDVIRVYETEAADIINIKLAKVGGISKGKQVATIAKALDIPCFGSGMCEVSVGVAASAHFIASTDNVNFEGEFAYGVSISEDTLLKTPLRIENGFMEVPRMAGLGVELDDRKIDKYKLTRGYCVRKHIQGCLSSS